MTPKYLINSRVRLLRRSNDHITGARIVRVRATATGPRYDLVHDSGNLPDQREEEFEIQFFVSDHVERWAMPGPVGEIIGFDQGEPIVAWENAMPGSKPALVMRDALRTCQCQIQVGTDVNTPAGPGKVMSVCGLKVTVAVVVDSRTL